MIQPTLLVSQLILKNIQCLFLDGNNKWNEEKWIIYKQLIIEHEKSF